MKDNQVVELTLSITESNALNAICLQYDLDVQDILRRYMIVRSAELISIKGRDFSAVEYSIPVSIQTHLNIERAIGKHGLTVGDMIAPLLVKAKQGTLPVWLLPHTPNECCASPNINEDNKCLSCGSIQKCCGTPNIVKTFCQSCGTQHYG